MPEPLKLRTAASADTDVNSGIDYCGRHVLHRDYETRSTLLLKGVGNHKYAADSNTDVGQSDPKLQCD